jgi:hypothetical protein
MEDSSPRQWSVVSSSGLFQVSIILFESLFSKHCFYFPSQLRTHDYARQFTNPSRADFDPSHVDLDSPPVARFLRTPGRSITFSPSPMVVAISVQLPPPAYRHTPSTSDLTC